MVTRPFAAYRGPDKYVFVSYAHDDAGMVYPELLRLRAAGLNVWYDEGIAPGSSWREDLALSISDSSAFVFVITPRSVRSHNCVREVNFALDATIPVLSVFLEPTDLPPGLKLALGDRQAILRHELSASDYEDKLVTTLRRLVGKSDAPAPRPPAPPRRPVTIWLAVALAVVVIGGVAVNRDRIMPTVEPPTQWSAPTDDLSLAVMRFASIGDDAAFTDGLSERLLQLLTRVRELSVPSRSSAWALSNQQINVHDAAQKLRVRFVLEGSVQRHSGDIRVIVRLIDAVIDKQIWSESYDRTLTAENFFAIQDDIARQVVEKLKVTLSAESRAALAKVPTLDTRALTRYLEGRERLRRPASEENLTEAIAAFNAAIELDSDYTEAHAGLCEAQLAWYAFSQETDRYRAAESACLAALQHDNSLGEVLGALGSLHRYGGRLTEATIELKKATELLPHDAAILEELARTYQAAGQLQSAEATFDAAIRAEPGNWSVYKSKGNFLFRTGRAADAVPYYEITLTLDPDNAVARTNLGVALTMIGRFDAALAAWREFIDHDPPYLALMGYANALYYKRDYTGSVVMLKRALAKNPSDHRAWRNLGDSLRYVPGQADAARDAYLKVIELARQNLRVNPDSSETLSSLAAAYARTDQRELAREMLARLDEVGWDDPGAAFLVAVTRLALGDRAGALDAARRAIANGFSPALIAAEPDFAEFEKAGQLNAVASDSTHEGGNSK